MFVDDLEQPQTVAASFFAIEAANADRNSGGDLRDEMFPLMAADYTDSMHRLYGKSSKRQAFYFERVALQAADSK